MCELSIRHRLRLATNRIAGFPACVQTVCVGRARTSQEAFSFAPPISYQTFAQFLSICPLCDSNWHAAFPAVGTEIPLSGLWSPFVRRVGIVSIAANRKRIGEFAASRPASISPSPADGPPANES